MKSITILLFLVVTLNANADTSQSSDDTKLLGQHCTGLENNVDENIAICFNGIWEDPCDTGSTYGAAVCARRKLANDNKELNRLYKKALEKIGTHEKDKKFRLMFIKAERMWIKYRDAMCEFEFSSNDGESSKRECLTKITEHRIDAMSIFLNGCDDDGPCVAPW